LNARSLGLQPCALQESNDLPIEFGITVENDITIWSCFGEYLAQLLHNPVCGGMPTDVEVQDPSPAMLDDKQAVQLLERDCSDGEEIECNDRLAMVPKERYVSTCLRHLEA